MPPKRKAARTERKRSTAGAADCSAVVAANDGDGGHQEVCVIQKTSSNGLIVTTQRWEACSKELVRGSRYSWVITKRRVDESPSPPLSSEGVSISSYVTARVSSHPGCCVFLPRDIIAVLQDQYLNFYSLRAHEVSTTTTEDVPVLEPFASHHVGYAQPPIFVLGAAYLLMPNEDDGEQDHELSLYDVSKIQPEASEAMLRKPLRSVAWSRTTIASRLGKSKKGTSKAEISDDDDDDDDTDRDDSSDDDSAELSSCEMPMGRCALSRHHRRTFAFVVPTSRRAYPHWGVRVLDDGWIATVPAGDEAPGRYGQPYISLYRVSEEEENGEFKPVRIGDIPVVGADDVLTFFLQMKRYLCIVYRSIPPQFWDLKKKQLLRYPKEDVVRLFRTGHQLGLCFPSAADACLLQAVCDGKLKKVKAVVEGEGANVLTRDFDAAISSGNIQVNDSAIHATTSDDVEDAHEDGDQGALSKALSGVRLGWNAEVSLGPTALYYAVIRQDLPMIKFLLRSCRGKPAQRKALLLQRFRSSVYSMPYSNAAASTSLDLLACVELVAQGSSSPAVTSLIRKMLTRLISKCGSTNYENEASCDELSEADENQEEAAVAEDECAVKAQIRREAALTALFDTVDLRRQQEQQEMGGRGKRPRKLTDKQLSSMIDEAVNAGCDLRKDVRPRGSSDSNQLVIYAGDSVPLFFPALMSLNLPALKVLLESPHVFASSEERATTILSPMPRSLQSHGHNRVTPLHIAAQSPQVQTALKLYVPAHCLEFGNAVALQDADRMRVIIEDWKKKRETRGEASPSQLPSKQQLRLELLHFSLHADQEPLVVACKFKSIAMAKVLVENGASLLQRSGQHANAGVVELCRAFYSTVPDGSLSWLSETVLPLARKEVMEEYATSSSVVGVGAAATVELALLHGAVLHADEPTVTRLLSCSSLRTHLNQSTWTSFPLLYTAAVEARHPGITGLLLAAGCKVRCMSVASRRDFKMTTGQAEDDANDDDGRRASLFNYISSNRHNLIRQQPAVTPSDGVSSPPTSSFIDSLLEVMRPYRSASERLIEAVRASDVSLVQELLLPPHNADPNSRDYDSQQTGFTALHFAMLLQASAKIPICQALVAAGANPTLQDELIGRTVLSSVTLYTDPEVFLLLQPKQHPLAHHAELYAAIRRACVNELTMVLEKLSLRADGGRLCDFLEPEPRPADATPAAVQLNVVQQHRVNPLHFATQLYFNAASNHVVLPACDAELDIDDERCGLVLHAADDNNDAIQPCEAASHHSALTHDDDDDDDDEGVDASPPCTESFFVSPQSRAMYKYLYVIAVLVSRGVSVLKKEDDVSNEAWKMYKMYHEQYWRLRRAAEDVLEQHRGDGGDTMTEKSPTAVLTTAKRCIFEMKAWHAFSYGDLATLKALRVKQLSQSPEFPSSFIKLSECLGLTLGSACPSVLDLAIRSNRVEVVNWLLHVEPNWPEGSWSGYTSSLAMWVCMIRKRVQPAATAATAASGTNLGGSPIREVDAALLLAVSKKNIPLIERLVTHKGGDVNFSCGPAAYPSPLRIALKDPPLVQRLLELGADPRKPAEADSTTPIQACEAAMQYTYSECYKLVHTYCLLTNAHGGDAVALRRLLVNFEVREHTRFLLQNEPKESFLSLLRDPLLLPGSNWDSILKQCGVAKDRHVQQVLTAACPAHGTLMEHVVVAHPAVLVAVMNIPGVVVTATMKRDILRFRPNNASLLEAKTPEERLAALSAMSSSSGQGGGHGLART